MNQPDTSQRVPQQTRSIERRERILHATAELLERSDYAAINVQSIAQQAETSVGSIYQFFPNKDAVLEALAATYVQEMGESSPDVFRASNLPLEEQVKRTVLYLVEFANQHPGFHHLMKSSWVSPELRVSIEAMFGQMHNAVAAMIGSFGPHLTERQRRVSGHMVMGMVYGVISMLPKIPTEVHDDIIIEVICSVAIYIETTTKK
jgi:AcrR family transcriptional regulator